MKKTIKQLMKEEDKIFGSYFRQSPAKRSEASYVKRDYAELNTSKKRITYMAGQVN
jgi:hypothetical protein